MITTNLNFTLQVTCYHDTNHGTGVQEQELGFLKTGKNINSGISILYSIMNLT